jgi:hypothetical protein
MICMRQVLQPRDDDRCLEGGRVYRQRDAGLKQGTESMSGYNADRSAVSDSARWIMPLEVLRGRSWEAREM